MRSICLFLTLSFTACGKAYAFTGFQKNELVIGWGPSYRIQDNFYHHFEIAHESYETGCTHTKIVGLGVRADLFNDDNYSIALKYYHTTRKLSEHTLLPYWGISPVYFNCNNVSGLNLKPEFGLRFIPIDWTFIGFSLNVSYGYQIPIIAELDYSPGRHDISATVGFTIDINRIRRPFFVKGEKVDAVF